MFHLSVLLVLQAENVVSALDNILPEPFAQMHRPRLLVSGGQSDPQIVPLSQSRGHSSVNMSQ